MTNTKAIALVGMGVGGLFGLGAVSTLQAANAAGASGAAAAQTQLNSEALFNGAVAAAILGVSYHYFKKGR